MRMWVILYLWGRRSQRQCLFNLPVVTNFGVETTHFYFCQCFAPLGYFSDCSLFEWAIQRFINSGWIFIHFQGYLFISVLVGANNELMKLVIQAIKNDLHARNPVHVCLALQCVANIGSREMAEGLGNEIPKLLVSGWVSQLCSVNWAYWWLINSNNVWILVSMSDWDFVIRWALGLLHNISYYSGACQTKVQVDGFYGNHNLSL